MSSPKSSHNSSGPQATSPEQTHSSKELASPGDEPSESWAAHGARMSTQVGTKESGASFQSRGSSRGSAVRFIDSDTLSNEDVDSPTHGSEGARDSHHFLEIPDSQRQSLSKPSSLQVLDSLPQQSRRANTSSKDTQNSHVTQDTQGSRMSMSSFHGGSSKSPRGSTASESVRPDPSRHTTKDTNLTGETGDSSGSHDRRSHPSSKSLKKQSTRKSSSRSRPRSVGRSGGRSSGTSSRSSVSSSSSDELSERELALMDQSVLPLHLREGAIRSKDDDFGKDLQVFSQMQQLMLEDENVTMMEDDGQTSEKDTRSKLLIFLSRLLGHEDGQFNDIRKLRKESIMMQNWQFVIRVYPCVAWCVVVMFLLFIWLLRYFGTIETDAQRVVARSLMLQTEVRVAASLAPTFSLVSSLAMAAKAGLLSNSSYADLANVVTPHFLANPSVQLVHIVGATERAATLKPGSIHEESKQVHERIPLMLVSPAECEHSKKNPMLCLGLDQRALIDVPEDGTSVRWQKPGFLTEGSKGQPLNVTNWLYSHRLAAQIDATDTTKGLKLAVEAAIDLSRVDSVVRASVLDKGAIYITTADGTVIAGSNWMAQGVAQYDPVSGTVMYPRLWDLGLSWTKELTEAMVSGSRQADVWSGTDIVVVRPLSVGHPSSGSFKAGLIDLRIVSAVPRKAATSEEMKNLIIAGMVSLGAPGVFFLLVLLILLMSACVMSFLHWLFDCVMSYQ